MADRSIADMWRDYQNTGTKNSIFTNTGILDSKAVWADLNKKDANTVKAIASALNNAGYRVPTSGKVTPAFFTQYMKAMSEAQAFTVAVKNENFSESAFATFLTEKAADNSGSGGGASVRIASATDAAALINAVFKDQLGRTASKDEVKKYTSMIQQAERRNPVMSNGGVTSGGINEQQFLIDQIAESDEATQNRALTAFDALAKMLGSGA